MFFFSSQTSPFIYAYEIMTKVNMIEKRAPTDVFKVEFYLSSFMLKFSPKKSKDFSFWIMSQFYEAGDYGAFILVYIIRLETLRSFIF